MLPYKDGRYGYQHQCHHQHKDDEEDETQQNSENCNKKKRKRICLSFHIISQMVANDSGSESSSDAVAVEAEVKREVGQE